MDIFVELEQLGYEEDRVLNGVLHYLYEGEWVEYTNVELTEMLIAEQDFFIELCNRNYSKYVN